jgi:hypothetical protein
MIGGVSSFVVETPKKKLTFTGLRVAEDHCRPDVACVNLGAPRDGAPRPPASNQAPSALPETTSLGTKVAATSSTTASFGVSTAPGPSFSNQGSGAPLMPNPYVPFAAPPPREGAVFSTGGRGSVAGPSSKQQGQRPRQVGLREYVTVEASGRGSTGASEAPKRPLLVTADTASVIPSASKSQRVTSPVTRDGNKTVIIFTHSYKRKWTIHFLVICNMF